MIVYKAEPQYIDVLWPYVGPLLNKAIDRTIGEINLEDVKDWLKEERQQLWVIVDEQEQEIIGAFTTEIYIYPNQNSMQEILFVFFFLEHKLLYIFDQYLYNFSNFL